MRLHAEKTNSRVFPVLSQAYIHRIREIHAEIRAYLQTHPDPVGGRRPALYGNLERGMSQQ